MELDLKRGPFGVPDMKSHSIMNSNAQSPFRSFPFSPVESHIERIGSFNNLAVAFSGAIKPKKLVLSNFQRDTKRLPPSKISE